MGGSLALLQRPEGRMDYVLRPAAVSLQVRREGGLNFQMVQGTSGKDRKRLICPAPPGCWQTAQLAMWVVQVEMGMGPGCS